ncbi:MAG TPA: transposase [Terriglobia bacterium]|nr:transposase [Terriglobia bacterium]
MSAPNFIRKPNRLPRASYLGQQWYFITLCSGSDGATFSHCALVELLLDVLREQCHACSFDLYAYCFMPDHVHLELSGQSDDSDAIRLLHDFKGTATARARGLGVRKLWERGFYDHILRENDDHNAVAWYIFNNPVRKGLVQDARDWPYSGSWSMDWKKAMAPINPYVPPWK